MTGTETSAHATLDVALSHAASLLSLDPALAQVQADEILRAAPGHPMALMLLGAALRRQGDFTAARAVLEPLARSQPRAPQVHVEFGLLLAAARETDSAIAALTHAITLKPAQPDVWRALGDLAILAQRPAEADRAYAQSVRWSTEDAELMDAALALSEDRLSVAERLLKARLKDAPTDVAAIRMLAEVAGRLGRYGDAETLLRRALELSPTFTAARHNLAIVLYRQVRLEEALAEVEQLLADHPDDPNFRNLKAGALARLGDVETSITVYGRMLKDHPNQPKGWLSYGHVLKTAGRSEDGVKAYRRAIALEPSFGDAYWSLANLKTFRFHDDEIAAMEAQIARGDLDLEDRFHLHFALGKALEDAGDYAAAFAHYSDGARLRRSLLQYDPEETTDHAHRSIALFTEAFFEARRGFGCDAQDPVFVVGLPRSGSTLIEQILDCHSAVEGTAELAELGFIARGFSGRTRRSEATRYPDATADMTADRALPRANQGPAAHGQAVVHRQAAQQLCAHRPAPADPAQREDHRRAPPSPRNLLLGVQAALRPRAVLLLRSHRDRALLRRLCPADGSLRSRRAGRGSPRDLRAHGGRPGNGGAPPARLLPPALRRRLPALLRERPGRPHGEFRTGPTADLQGRDRSLATF